MSEPPPPPDKIFDQVVSSLPLLIGKVYGVTGCTSGTGYFACVAAIARKAKVLLLLNRPSKRAYAAVAKLRKLGAGGTIIQHIDCDLASFASTTAAAAEVAALIQQEGWGGMDGLLCNAGVMGMPDVRTVDGYDLQAQTNHLSHYLLAKLLMPTLNTAARVRGEGRIIQHSSGARSKERGTAEDGQGLLESKYFAAGLPGTLGGSDLKACFSRYHQTKLANSVFAQMLHHELTAAGSRVKSMCAEPGVAQTDLGLNLVEGHRTAAGNELEGLSMAATYAGIQSPADGACSLMMAAFSAVAQSGDFYMPGDRDRNTPVGIPVRCMTAGVPTPSGPNGAFIAKRFENEKLTMDPRNRAMLLAVSEEAVCRWERVGRWMIPRVATASKL